jgi:hypothetical protein
MENDIIKVGSVVESRLDGWQGMVTEIHHSLILWLEIYSDWELLRNYIDGYDPPLTDKDIFERKWIITTGFSRELFNGSASFGRDLYVIPFLNVRLEKGILFYTGRITAVHEYKAYSVINALIETGSSTGATLVLTITWPKRKFDLDSVIYGTADFVFVTMNGINHPYRRTENKLSEL